MLAEMVKVSDIGIDVLVDFIRENNATETDWQSMLLPTGMDNATPFRQGRQRSY